MKKFIAVIAAIAVIITSLFGISAFAEGNIKYPTGISDEMCDSSYWYDKGLGDTDKLLMTLDEVEAVNQTTFNTPDTNVDDLFNMAEDYNATALKNEFVNNIEQPGFDMYIDGVLVDTDEYLKKITSAIDKTGYDGMAKIQYAVCANQADLKAYPTDDMIGDSDTDSSDEMQSSRLCVNEPFVIKQKCDIDGKTFYWGNSYNCTGWINGANLAICKDKAEWMDACKFDINAKDFVVVTQSKVVTEVSRFAPYCSEVNLPFGTILKLVPEDEIPATIGERGTWNNYVVYLPTRDANGKYVKQPALISQHYKLSVGFVPFTQKNLLDVAFNCLGDRYGWSGMLKAMDCSLYIRNIYRCFGFEFPRNTTWQQYIPNTLIDMTAMSDIQKEQLIETLPIGTPLYFNGHTMMYTGTQDKTNYAISATGFIIDSAGEKISQRQYSVILNPLTVRRSDGNTWLHHLTSAVVVMPKIDMAECTVTAVEDVEGNVKASVSYGSNELYEDVNFTVEHDKKTATVSGINFYTGQKTVKIKKPNIFQKICHFFKTVFRKFISLFK